MCIKMKFFKQWFLVLIIFNVIETLTNHSPGHIPFADPNPELDVWEANRKFMELSEELYDALIDCHWQPSAGAADLGLSLSLPETVHC